MKGQTKLYIALAVVGVFAFFKFLKSLDPSINSNSDQITASELSEIDLAHYRRSRLDNGKTGLEQKRLTIQPLAGTRGRLPKGRSQGKHHNGGKKVTMKKKDKTDKKANKKDSKKDADKKKKNDEGPVGPSRLKQIARQADADKPNNNPAEDSGTSAEGSTLSTAVAGGAPTSPEDDKLLMSYDEWAELVLSGPNFKNTSKLIEHYDTNLVTDEIFFRLLDEMTIDPRPRMREMALMAASNTQKNHRSFIAIAKIIENEAYGSKLQNKARAASATYAADLKNVNELITVLKTSENAYAQTLATQVIEIAAKRHLKVAKPTDNQGQSEGVDQASEGTADDKTKDYFRNVASILSSIIEGGTLEVQAQTTAGDALNNINRLLSA